MSDKTLDLLVKGTLWLLVGSSVLTWALVLIKGVQQWRVGRASRRFFARFGRPVKLPDLNDLAGTSGPVARLARAGLTAVDDALGPHGTPPEDRQTFIENSLRQQMQKERRTIEAGLAVLASIGTTAPFVGLFGTVFGIIHALKSISGAGAASVDVVAGPIGEALIATGVGIAVAIPALLAYNLFVRKLKGTWADWEDFATTFLNLTLRAHVREARPLVSRDLPRAREVSV
jgi:biopolymer transport protein ExbB